MNQSRHEKVLILRLWYEPREIAGAAPVLRGSVVDVDSGEEQWVGSLAEIAETIEARLDELLPREN